MPVLDHPLKSVSVDNSTFRREYLYRPFLKKRVVRAADVPPGHFVIVDLDGDQLPPAEIDERYQEVHSFVFGTRTIDSSDASPLSILEDQHVQGAAPYNLIIYAPDIPELGRRQSFDTESPTRETAEQKLDIGLLENISDFVYRDERDTTVQLDINWHFRPTTDLSKRSYRLDKISPSDPDVTAVTIWAQRLEHLADISENRRFLGVQVEESWIVRPRPNLPIGSVLFDGDQAKIVIDRIDAPKGFTTIRTVYVEPPTYPTLPYSPAEVPEEEDEDMPANQVLVRLNADEAIGLTEENVITARITPTSADSIIEIKGGLIMASDPQSGVNLSYTIRNGSTDLMPSNRAVIQSAEHPHYLENFHEPGSTNEQTYHLRIRGNGARVSRGSYLYLREIL